MKLQLISVGCLLLSVVLFSTVQVSAQDASGLSPEEYEAELARWQARESSASVEASRLNRDIESLKEEIAEIEKTITQERQAIFGLRTASDDEIREYMAKLKKLELDVANLENLSGEELLGDVELLEDIELRLENLSEDDLAALEQNRNLLSDIDNMLSNYRTVIPEPAQDDETLASNDAVSLSEEKPEEDSGEPEAGESAEIGEDIVMGEEDSAEVSRDGEVPKVVQFERKADSYRVIRGDSLWKISGKEKIYNDPLQWLKIYSANRDQISNPDVISFQESRHLTNIG